MSENQAERFERALHDAEVRLWVEERELELLPHDAPAAVRSDLVAEVARLRDVVDARRADVEHDDSEVERVPAVEHDDSEVNRVPGVVVDGAAQPGTGAIADAAAGA